ncbi:carboxypeptidase regulatory-like domain-containing protein [Horticoccus sp. 23ND18S-11]|uniref:carboxypeptidase regulatory-like domain-containing protein n=1 Tax=Horticoccus sp. 23ND18S-11 TaxID=3391832 RepID=UPI0039C9E957
MTFRCPAFDVPSLLLARLRCVLVTLLLPFCQAAELPTRSFDLPAGDALATLKQFSTQAGARLLYSVDAVRGVTTNAVKGAYTPRDALVRLVANTGLVVSEATTDGALAVSRGSAPVPNGSRAAPIAAAARPDRNRDAPSSAGRTPGNEGAGAVEGTVADARRGEYLEKARITVEGTAIETFTDATGRYRLAGVPAGAARVRVFFTGLGAHVEVVEVAAGRSTTQDFSVTGPGTWIGGAGSTVKMDQFVVSTTKEMDAAAIAINEQRFAPNQVKVVSADEFGTVSDGRVGEFMKFLPGIVFDYSGGDAVRVSMSGVSPDNVPITFGGFDLASSAGASTSRATELNELSLNSISRVEVLYSPTPESPGMALAGSVNFVPRSAFERSKPAFNYSVSVLMKDAERHWGKTPGPRWEPSRKINPGFDFSAIVPVNRNFGFTVTGGYSKDYAMEDNSQLTWRGVGGATLAPAANGTPGALPDTTPNNPYATNYTLRDSGKFTERKSMSTTLDYRLTSSDRLSFAFQYALTMQAYASRFLAFNINRVEPGNWGPTFTHGAVGGSEVAITTRGRILPGRTFMPSLIYRHDGPVWKAESGVSYSNSRLHYQDIDKDAFDANFGRRTGVTVSFDDIFYLRPGRFTVTDGVTGAPVNPYDINSYSLTTAASTRTLAYDTKRTAFANLRRDLEVRGVPVTLKGGLDVRTAARDLNGVGQELFTFVGRDGRTSTTPVNSDDGAGIALDESFSTRTPPYGFPPTQYISGKRYLDLYKSNPELFTRNPNNDYRNAANVSKRAEETISSAYLRADVALLQGRLKLIGGVRAEQTNIDAAGPLADPTANFQRDAAGNILRAANGTPILIVPTTDALGVSRLTLIPRGMQAKKEYLRYFPNLNVNYNVAENLIARASFFTSVGRPDYNQYAGGITLPNLSALPSSTNRIQVNNVGINAWSAETVRVRLEYYFERVGQISLGAFRRNFTNFFGTTSFQPTPEFLAYYDLDADSYGGYEVFTQYNLPDTVRMDGMELDYKQALTFLPHWARGVQVFGNVTLLRAVGTDFFPDLIPKNFNWGVSLTRSKYNLRANWNYRGIQRRAPVAAGRSIEPGTYNYRSKRLYVDISGEYQLTRRFGLFFALRNVGAASEDDKIYGPSTPDYARFFRRQDYGSQWSFGVKGTL